MNVAFSSFHFKEVGLQQKTENQEAESGKNKTKLFFAYSKGLFW